MLEGASSPLLGGRGGAWGWLWGPNSNHGVFKRDPNDGLMVVWVWSVVGGGVLGWWWWCVVLGVGVGRWFGGLSTVPSHLCLSYRMTAAIRFWWWGGLLDLGGATAPTQRNMY